VFASRPSAYFIELYYHPDRQTYPNCGNTRETFPITAVFPCRLYSFLHVWCCVCCLSHIVGMPVTSPMQNCTRDAPFVNRSCT